MTAQRLYDHDAIMDMWAKGTSAKEIADVLNMERVESVYSVVKEYRGRGDERATKHIGGRSTWTKENDDRLRALHGNGYSFGLIAQKLGLTRNSIVGRAHRIGLMGHATPDTRKSARYRTGAPRKPRIRKPRGPSTIAREPVVAVRPDIPEPESLNVSILDVTDKQCKFGHGDPRDPGFSLCGHPAVEGTSWCEHHLARVSVPVRRSVKHFYLPRAA